MNNGRSIFSHRRKENNGLQVCRTLDIQETLEETLQVVSFLVFCQKTHSGYVSCTHLHPVTSLPWKQCHLVVGHTLRYIMFNFGANWTDSSWVDFFVPYPSPWISSILTIISTWSPAAEIWPQNQHQCHNNSSPSLPRPLQMLLPVHWQLGQPP